MDQKDYYQKVISFANENPACHLATSVNDQPHVRGMLLWYADPSGFYFHTSSTKALAGQIKKNPKVEVAFIRHGPNQGEINALRVTGLATVLDDPSIEERLLEERPWLREYEKISPDSKAFIFKVSQGEAFLWDMSKNLREKEIERLVI